ncbi:quinone oxidoreductase [Neisseria chenwenguii]|uniref:Quinone oxidoreductase n=1 Tax=Neisseria chenwenguii TaxID=1853278 RepID=A0A220RYW2_9NEIS|nr:zinc-binding dehydrogenase [Neisseria chenwenguii]ASK26401.1 quinone oxidoreductase [Neisseria chenwenguii]
MKANVVHRPGGAEVLVLEDVPVPAVKSGWSLVKVKGFGINHSEIFTRQGKSPSVKFPRILGIECAGEIAETTDEARLPAGCRVVSLMGEMGRDFDGSYAEFVLLPNAQIYRVETDLDWASLAAVPETFYTAFGSMGKLCIGAGDKILVRAAAGGVGVAFAKLVKAKFPNVVLHGSTRSPEKAAKLHEAGFDEVVLEQEGRLKTSDSYHKILDLVGTATLKDSFSHIAERGIVCATGQLGGKWFLEDFDPIVELKNDSYLTAFYSGLVSEARIRRLFDYIETYRVDVKPEKVFTLEQVAEAHRFVESREGFGKAVVLVSDGH